VWQPAEACLESAALELPTRTNGWREKSSDGRMRRLPRGCINNRIQARRKKWTSVLEHYPRIVIHVLDAR